MVSKYYCSKYFSELILNDEYEGFFYFHFCSPKIIKIAGVDQMAIRRKWLAKPFSLN